MHQQATVRSGRLVLQQKLRIRYCPVLIDCGGWLFDTDVAWHISVLNHLSLFAAANATATLDHNGSSKTARVIAKSNVELGSHNCSICG